MTGRRSEIQGTGPDSPSVRSAFAPESPGLPASGAGAARQSPPDRTPATNTQGISWLLKSSDFAIPHLSSATTPTRPFSNTRACPGRALRRTNSVNFWEGGALKQRRRV